MPSCPPPPLIPTPQANQYYLVGVYATGIPGLAEVPGLPGPVEIAGAINFCIGDYLFGEAAQPHQSPWHAHAGQQGCQMLCACSNSRTRRG